MREEGEIAGLRIEDAVRDVVERGEAENPTAARAALEEVADDGVVSWEAAREAFAHLAKVVSTPETRLELAAAELDSAREAANEVGERPLVRTRVETFEARYESVEARVTALGAELADLLDQRGEPGNLYAVAEGIRSLTVEANDCQQTADELQVALEEFQRWLDDPAVRYEAFAGDLDAFAESLHDLEAVPEAISSGDRQEPAAGWLDATVQARVLELVVADLGWEIDELRRWDGNSVNAAEEAAAELASETARLQAIRDRLDEVAKPDWADRYEDHLTAVDSTLAEFEPPVDWGAVERALESNPRSE